ncbi:ABC transporter ATP-binding protein [Kocuria rhizophila]|uniref:ABC transporter ATP-binding protein n=1 Tax=Kocuria rhizophila TaxID=72000 RepID=UPI000750072B|nr:ABC transporter ATP-binding protein [Kocuria rhizophila]MXN61092.1 ATP-binding cassette domain-containing protein [Bacillus sp. BGMRC0062]KUP28607.1 ABC transporter [Kocuria rhizophila]MDA4827768.1 ABC transporter ATP-binding protein [Kocuria rhizophila]QTK31729.1 ABC transporter ATP-binding protein [Kocuria rhizophila]WSQ04135.1 ABC transporter ATP-binding protein [Kocuria rhizophila]
MIRIEHLTKRYGGFTAVDDISFTAQPGRVTGFLGPNGAGKSTALRMLTGLTPASSGEALVLGRRYAELPNPSQHVGVMLDAAAQHPGRTGREVLQLAATITGAGKARVDEMLDLVGLEPSEARRRVKNYSLGMRQRLGLAGALMGSPQVLVLDEPANGLDPAGIRWMRGLLRGFANQGGTVLLSSHLLHEVEQVADDLVMIGHGRIVAQGRMTDLLATRPGCVADAEDRPAFATALSAAGISFSGRADGAAEIEADAARVGRVALDAGVPLTLLRPADGTRLEDMFLQLTADTARDEQGRGGTPPGAAASSATTPHPPQQPSPAQGLPAREEPTA